MKKRIMPLILALLMVLACTACGGEGGGKPAASVALTEGGAAAYKVVYPAGASAEIMSTVSYLQTALQQICGVEFRAEEDMATSPSAEKKEILVGATDRSESKEAAGTMSGSGEYVVKVSGNQIVLVGMLDAGVQAAAEQLVADLKGAAEKATLAGNYSVKGTSDSAMQYLPAYTYGKLQTSYDCGDDADMLIYDYSKDGFASYCKDLESAGFAKYTDNAIGENSFATYTKDGVMAHVMSLPGLKSVRIVAQKDAVLPAVSAPSVTAVVQPSVTQLGLEGYEVSGNTNQKGMSFLYQLSDGSFVIFDGGHNKAEAADQLYNKMKDMAPDSANITVRAWFISHAHPDHAGCLLYFGQNYAGKLKVEQVICNLPNDMEMDGGSDSSSDYRVKIADAADKLGAQLVKTYTGQVHYLGDAVIEVLCSIETVAPQTFADYNNSSLIVSVELSGQKLMQLADCGPLQTPVLLALYGDVLKSNIVQNGHHGYRGASVALYQAIDPDYMFWPGGSRVYENYKGEDYNAWVLGRVKENWLALDQVITKTLPIG